MKLYSSAISPYAARCRVQIHHKNLPVEIAAPPGGMGSAQVKSMNPVGKIPVLDLGGETLAESWAIMEFLEARFPAPPMLPDDPIAIARQRELVRFTDLYLAPAMFPMFRALRGASVDIPEALKGLQAQLDLLEQLLPRQSAGLELTLAEAALLPILWYAQVLAQHNGLADCLTGRSQVVKTWDRARTLPAAAKVLSEMETGLRATVPVLFAAK